MYHRPVCVKCEVDLRPETNGVKVLDHANFGPYKLWDADLWKCPICEIQVVIGFGSLPLSEHYKNGFKEAVERAKPVLINSRECKKSV